MTLFAVICLLASLGLVGGVAYPRTRKLLLVAREPLKQLPGETEALREWKAVFRDTVVSVDGQISPEMEAFLMGEEERASKLLADAKTAAEKERAEIVAKAEKECAEIAEKATRLRAEIMKEDEDWVENDRPLLAGAAFKEYTDDYKSSTSDRERGNVVHRWHSKGF